MDSGGLVSLEIFDDYKILNICGLKIDEEVFFMCIILEFLLSISRHTILHFSNIPFFFSNRLVLVSKPLSFILPKYNPFVFPYSSSSLIPKVSNHFI
jgi:hypothetical protein